MTNTEKAVTDAGKAQRTEEQFFAEAFTNPVTGKPYEIPANLKQVATRICRIYGIKGVCDPMYIANVIAVELGLGDGYMRKERDDARSHADKLAAALREIANSHPYDGIPMRKIARAALAPYDASKGGKQ